MTKVLPIKAKSTVKIPNLFESLRRMGTAEWLEIKNDDIEGARESFMSENVNLSLICALLFTTFLPIYYAEPSRINSDTDGLSLDISLGYLNTQHAINFLPNSWIHDIFDVTYFLAMGGTMFGTLSSVYFSIAAAIAGTDTKVVQLRKWLGKGAVIPYFYFSIGAAGWGTGIWFHLIIVARTPTGFLIKVISIIIIILTCFYVIGRLVQGLYVGHEEDKIHKPVTISGQELRVKCNEFFEKSASEGKQGELRELLVYLRGEPNENFFIPLLAESTKLGATMVFYERMATVLGRSYSETLELVKLNQGRED